MAAREEYPLSRSDAAVLRDVAERVAEISHLPENVARRENWLSLHAPCPDARPMVLAEWGGVRDEKRPHAPDLECEADWTRGVENGLRNRIWIFEELRDDHVIEPVVDVPWRVTCSGYGVEAVMHESDDAGILGAKRWDAPIADLDADFDGLRPREFSVDRQVSLAYKAAVEEAVGDILTVRFRGGYWWTLGMTIQAINLIGLEGLMLAMYDNPAGLHRLMAFLRDEHLRFVEWLEREELLTLNNDHDYVGSGTVGYVPDLPAGGKAEGEPVHAKDTWALLESQETVGVGPEQFAEFIFPCQKAVADRFGLLYYGCCEPLHTRWEVVRGFGNLRAISVAPLCDQERIAEAAGSKYVYSRKPNPTLISTDRFDEEAIREDVRVTLDACRRHRCPLEIVMKDVHTLNNKPERLARWVALAREEIAAAR